MKTSYLAKSHDLEYPVCITQGRPGFYQDSMYEKLAPKKSFLWAYKNGEIGANEYTRQYIKQVLEPLDVHNTWKEICKIYPTADSEDITLLCYEKPGDFCHRHLVAIWFRQAGYDIDER